MRRLPLIAAVLLVSQFDPLGAATPQQPDPVRVMSFNIEWGGTHVSFDKVVETIRRSRADVVGIQEAEGNLQRLANALGWSFDQRTYVISRFPLVSHDAGHGRYVYVEAQPGRAFVMANVHLPSDPYGPDLFKQGASKNKVREVETNLRLPALRPFINVLGAPATGGFPIVVTGDFNTPSHADWTANTAGSRPYLDRPFEWPVTQSMEQAGFTDAWRAVYSDPLRNPGLTWWAGRPALEAYAPGPEDPQDRIDFIWVRGPVSVQGVELAGEPGAAEVSLPTDPWPSDHRAVVADLEIALHPLPTLITTAKRVHRHGEPIEIVLTAAGDWSVEAQHAGDEPDSSSRYQTVKSGPDRWQILAGKFEPGRYSLTACDAAVHCLENREFWILAENAHSEIEVVEAPKAAGMPVAVRWRNAPGLRNDYVALVAEGTAPGEDTLPGWAYVDAQPEGELALPTRHSASGKLLPAGNYRVALLKDDGYEVLAETPGFSIPGALTLPADFETFDDGRPSLPKIFTSFEPLLAEGWEAEIIIHSQPAGTSQPLPVIALRSPATGPALWLLAGIHGEEPAGPIALSRSVEELARFGRNHPVVVLPLLNPWGYARNWRYLNMSAYIDGAEVQSVGDSSHLLENPERRGTARAVVSSPEAGAITAYILDHMAEYPVLYSLDLHEDNLIDQGYVYSQGRLGSADQLAQLAIRSLREHRIAIKASGETRFGEVIEDGVIGPVKDSSIDELMSSEFVITPSGLAKGPFARTVLVLETPAADLPLDTRVRAHATLVRDLLVTLQPD